LLLVGLGQRLAKPRALSVVPTGNYITHQRYGHTFLWLRSPEEKHSDSQSSRSRPHNLLLYKGSGLFNTRDLTLATQRLILICYIHSRSLHNKAKRF